MAETNGAVVLVGPPAKDSITFQLYGWAYSSRMSLALIKNSYLPKANYLPAQFTLGDIKPGTFTSSVMKRLKAAKKDGSSILVRNGKGYQIGIKVINKKERLERKKNIKQIKAQLKSMREKNADVKLFFSLFGKLAVLTNGLEADGFLLKLIVLRQTT